MSTITVNMNLVVPSIGDSDYPTSISNTFDLIDDHDHSSGKGSQIITAGITDSAVTTPKILDSAVTVAKLASDAVTTIKILDSAVTTAKINNLAVTNEKRAALGQQISATNDFSSGVNGTFTSISPLSVTITCIGRPVFVGLISDATEDLLTPSASDGAHIGVENVGGVASKEMLLLFLRDGTTNVGMYRLFNYGIGGFIPSSAFFIIDVPPAGQHTYQLQLMSPGGDTFGVNNTKIVAYEL